MRKLILSIALILGSIGAYADETPVTGDVNNDGSVTVADVTALVNIINGTSANPYQDAEVNIADVDKDGNVNKNDITALVKIILGKSKDDDPETPGISDDPIDPGIILDEARGGQGSGYWDE